jgi:hypothetical protein
MNAAVCLIALAAAAFAADPQKSVVDGARALDHWWPNQYPWYDADDDRAGGDGIAPIDVSTPWWENWNPNWNLNWNWNWSADLSWLWTTMKYAAWATIAALAAYLIYAIVRFSSDREYRLAWLRKNAADANRQAEMRRRTEALPLPGDQRPLDLLDAARLCCAAGRYGEAIVYLFSHQLVQLDKHRRVHLARGKTNRQYLREIGPYSPLGRLFRQTMVAFEDVFFGHHAIGRTRYEACFGRLDEFEALAAENAP